MAGTEIVTVRGALTSVLRSNGTAILDDPRRLASFLFDLVGSEVPGMVVLGNVMDKKLLQPLKQLASDPMAHSAQAAEALIVEDLETRYSMERSKASSIACDLVGGVADAFGIAYTSHTAERRYQGAQPDSGPYGAGRPVGAAPFASDVVEQTVTAPVNPVQPAPPIDRKPSTSMLPVVLGIACLVLAGIVFALTRGAATNTTEPEVQYQTASPTDSNESPSNSTDEAASSSTNDSVPADTEGSAPTVTSESTSAETSTSKADSFPRSWRGTFDSDSTGEGDLFRSMRLQITDVEESGRLWGIVYIDPDSSHPNEGSGSYYVVGRIDWTSLEINLNFDGWLDQGGLKNKRRFTGTVDSQYTKIVGESYAAGGYGIWDMEVQS